MKEEIPQRPAAGNPSGTATGARQGATHAMPWERSTDVDAQSADDVRVIVSLLVAQCGSCIPIYYIYTEFNSILCCKTGVAWSSEYRDSHHSCHQHDCQIHNSNDLSGSVSVFPVPSIHQPVARLTSCFGSYGCSIQRILVLTTGQ